MKTKIEKPKGIPLRTYEFQVVGLVILDKKSYTFRVQPLHVPKKVSQQILEIAGAD